MGIVLDRQLVDLDNEEESWHDLEPSIFLTLKSFLKMIAYGHLLNELDANLEEVRRHKIKPESHEKLVKKYDKELSKLSLKYHPDRFSGCPISEQQDAHDKQAALNSVRTIINHLSKQFLEDIDIDYRYEYYANVDLSSIGNEEDVQKMTLNFQYQLIMLSEIKHEKIIANIKKFLITSEECINFYFENDNRNFVFCFNQALNILNECVRGYQSLVSEFGLVQEQCAKDYTLQSSISVVEQMATEIKRQLKSLQKLSDIARESLKGYFRIYAAEEYVDDYFVLPFVKYMNALIMCYVILGNTKNCSMLMSARNDYRAFKGKIPCFKQLDADNANQNYFKAYHIALYIQNPSLTNEICVRQLVCDHTSMAPNVLHFVCLNRFKNFMSEISDNLLKEFKADEHYIVRSVRQRTEEFDMEVENFFQEMSKRTKYSALCITDSFKGTGENMFLNSDSKYLPKMFANERRNVIFDKSKGENADNEGMLLEKLQGCYKEMRAKLTHIIIKDELRFQKLKQEFETQKKTQSVLMKKLSDFSAKRGEKLKEIVSDIDGENEKLLDELWQCREKGRMLLSKICLNYENASVQFAELSENLTEKARISKAGMQISEKSPRSVIGEKISGNVYGEDTLENANIVLEDNGEVFENACEEATVLSCNIRTETTTQGIVQESKTEIISPWKINSNPYRQESEVGVGGLKISENEIKCHVLNQESGEVSRKVTENRDKQSETNDVTNVEGQSDETQNATSFEQEVGSNALCIEELRQLKERMKKCTKNAKKSTQY